MYALYCRATTTKAPESVVDKLTIRAMTVTNEDMSAIAAVLATGFPLTTKRATQSHGSLYGFVDVEGTQLWSRESPSDDSNALVASCKFRCRAFYDVSSGGFVDLVVPGYGVCKTRLGDSTQFTPDVTKLRPNEKRLCDELVLVFQDFGVTMDLLKLAFISVVMNGSTAQHYGGVEGSSSHGCQHPEPDICARLNAGTKVSAQLLEVGCVVHRQVDTPIRAFTSGK